MTFKVFYPNAFGFRNDHRKGGVIFSTKIRFQFNGLFACFWKLNGLHFVEFAQRYATAVVYRCLYQIKTIITTKVSRAMPVKTFSFNSIGLGFPLRNFRYSSRFSLMDSWSFSRSNPQCRHTFFLERSSLKQIGQVLSQVSEVAIFNESEFCNAYNLLSLKVHV